MIAACIPWWFGVLKTELASLFGQRGRPWQLERLTATVLLLLFAMAAPVKAQEAWLVTYGPGEEVWEMFGHNALWLRDPETGLDHTYSFGYFEIDRAGFYVDFARGIMNYYGAASPADREFDFYRQRGRSVTAQKLALSAEQVQDLQKALHEAIYPHPQYYAYDYFRANCSTWLRDLINQVVDNALRTTLEGVMTDQSLAEHTRRMTRHRPWVQTGILALMGPSLDRRLTAWEESFLPEALAHWVGSVEVDGQPLVVQQRTIHAGSPPHSVVQLSSLTPIPLITGLMLAAAMLALIRRGGVLAEWSWRFGALTAGFVGAVLLAMMTLSGHHDTRWNLLVLLLHPLWWLLLVPRMRQRRRVLAIWIGVAAASGSLILAWPGLLQDRLDLLLVVVPVLLVTLWGASRTASQPS